MGGLPLPLGSIVCDIEIHGRSAGDVIISQHVVIESQGVDIFSLQRKGVSLPLLNLHRKIEKRLSGRNDFFPGYEVRRRDGKAHQQSHTAQQWRRYPSYME